MKPSATTKSGAAALSPAVERATTAQSARPNLSSLLQAFIVGIIYWIVLAVGLMIVLSALGIDITKEVLDPVTGIWEDANSPTGPLYPVGDVVNYRLEVCNTGDVDLNPVIIDDGDLGIAGFDIGALAAGACTTIDAGTIAELDSATACAAPVCWTRPC